MTLPQCCFDPDPIETHKIKKFKQADEYYTINGHVNAPQGDKSFDGLAVWIVSVASPRK